MTMSMRASARRFTRSPFQDRELARIVHFDGHKLRFVPVLRRVPAPWVFERKSVNEEMTYRVPGMTCAHCKEAVGGSLSSVSGVTAVDIDLDTKRVTVTGEGLDDADLRRAISDAGYEAA
jgi:copper chaperone